LGKNSNQILSDIINNVQYGLNKVNEYSSQFQAWQLILVTALITYLICQFFNYLNELENGLIDHLKKKLFRIAKKIPFLSGKIMQELDKTRKELEEGIIKANKGNPYITKLPDKSSTTKEVLAKVDNYLKMNTITWKDGSLSGCVYAADDAITELSTKVYEKFCWSNPLHAGKIDFIIKYY
jgi:sphinganine-1-phosphate aldolase